MRAARWIGAALILLIVTLGGVLVAARHHDGPIGPLVGGPLSDGEWVPSRGVDWSFVEPVREIELQLVEPPRSRTVWVVFHEGALYVPCGFLDLPFWKQWPHQALRDGRAVARILGRRYAFDAVRVEEEALFREILRRVAEKYELPSDQELSADSTWVFELVPRA